MCSILAVVSKQPIDDNLINVSKKILDDASPRGPDQQGLLIKNNVILGNNRLSIIGLNDSGKMPMKSLCGNYWIVFNGIIYNYKELKNYLTNHGCKFKTKTDTEVLLNAYIYFGKYKFIRYLNGLFAFVILDEKKNIIISGRDRFGGKPLYYTKINNRLFLNSDFRSLSNLYETNQRIIDNEALTAYLNFRFVPGRKTIHKTIYKFLPGELREWDLSTLNSKNLIFWKPKIKLKPFNQEEFDNALFKAIKYTSTSDANLSVLLSSGMDSAVVAFIAKQFFKKSINTYSFAFLKNNSNSEIKLENAYKITSVFDERNQANKIAKLLQLDNQGFATKYDIDIQTFTEILDIFGEPNASPNALGTFLFAKFLKNKTKVVLTGTGSDEFLGGYWNLYFKGKTFKESPFISFNEFLSRFSNFDIPNYDPNIFVNLEILNLDYVEKTIENISKQFDFKYKNEAINQLALFELNIGLPGWENDQADKLFSWNAIDSRPAFLENNFIDYLFTIPSIFKINKKPLRNFAKSYLPKNNLKFIKFPGMSTPVEIVHTPLFRNLINDLVYNPLPMWNKKNLKKITEMIINQQINFDIIYRLICIQFWIKKNKYKFI